VTPQEIDFEKIIPPAMLANLARAHKLHKFCMIFVVSPAVIAQLKLNQVACMTSKEGSCTIMVPQALLEEYYT